MSVSERAGSSGSWWGRLNRPGTSARWWLASTVVWLVVGPTIGFIGSLQMSYPEIFGAVRWIEFGRLRLAHVTVVVIGVIYMGMVAGYCHVVPQLCGRPLVSERLLTLCAWAWNGAVIAGVACALLGYSQGREWAELPWALDIAVLIVFATLSFEFMRTIRRRAVKELYPSLWYWVGTMSWFTMVWVVGNLIWLPPSGALTGLPDVIYNWFIGHNILALFITTAAVGLWYYFVPLLVDRPLYSVTLSAIGFWTYVGFYTQAGTHHLMQAPVPAWSKVLGLTVSVGLLVPVFTVITNLWMTLRGRWHLTLDNVALRFMAVASVFYLLTCLQGPSQGFLSFQRLVHFTNYVIGHAHLALLGTFAFLIMGVIYAMIPPVLGRPVYSRALQETHFWLAFVGFTVMFIVLTAAGLVQGSAWLSGERVEKVIGEMGPYFVVRSLFGLLVPVGTAIMAYNVWMTFRLARRESAEEAA